jgi:SNF family Na+-dependent transporter
MADVEIGPVVIKEDNIAAPERERWSSRFAFYFAAIGSAVGFGNVWRFPSLVYEYGGAAFLLPYLLALFLVGLPILVLEISLGQYYETGDVDVFGGIHRCLRGVGLSSIVCGLMLVTYYSMLIAWVLHAFFDTFSADSLWHQDPGTITTDQAKDYFENEILGMNTLGEDMLPTRMVWANVGYSSLTWVIVFLCIAWGIKTTGRITYFTLGFPVLMLFIFLGRSVTLEGADYGIEKYLKADFSTLIERPEVWPKAVRLVVVADHCCYSALTFAIDI